VKVVVVVMSVAVAASSGGLVGVTIIKDDQRKPSTISVQLQHDGNQNDARTMNDDPCSRGF